MDISLLPMAGINNVAEDAALQRGGDAPKLYVRDAVNVDITESGLPQLRSGVRPVTTAAYRNLWQSPLHGDVFGTLGHQWVRVDPTIWTHEALATIGEGDVSHEVLNNRVVVSGPAGLFVFDGGSAQRLTFDNAAPPMVAALGGGSLAAGTYGAAAAWLRGDLESQTSEATFVEVGEGGLLRVAFPLCMDPSVTGVRLYLTRQDGGELARAGDYPANAAPVDVPLLPELGRPAQFRNLSPMPAGAFLRYWRGRLLTARLNVLRWSEAMGYHLHDERHGFLQMPQRITFIEPVEGGIWIGQVDHVAFLEGTTPEGFSVRRLASRAPVPRSSIRLPAEAVGAAAEGGREVAVWLAENGYVLGTASGTMLELQAGTLKGITSLYGSSVLAGRRIITAVTS